MQKHVVRNRTFFVVGLGIVSVFGTRRAGVPGSGALAAIVTAFVAAYSWKETKVGKYFELYSNFHYKCCLLLVL